MSALDDVKEHARSAHGSLDEAAKYAVEASTEAENLSDEAARHGWQSVATTMSSAGESLDLVVSAIDDAMRTTSSGLTVLGAITERMSSNEVAILLGQAGEAFTSAHAEAGAAAETPGEVRADAEGADAHTTTVLIQETESHLETSQEALKKATDGTKSEEAMANVWGTESAEAGGQRLIYVPSPKHKRMRIGNISKAPEDGQAALDRSTPLSPETTTRRVGVDPVHGELVVFDETDPGTGRFHGHVKSWDEMRPRQRSALYKAGLIDLRGRIVP